MSHEEQECRSQLIVRIANDEPPEEVADAEPTGEIEGHLGAVVDDPARRRDETRETELSRPHREIRIAPRLWKCPGVDPAKPGEKVAVDCESHPGEPVALGDVVRVPEPL